MMEALMAAVASARTPCVVKVKSGKQRDAG
jgi:hypothetical protein